MAFKTQLTVRFGDIDQAGIVYYPRFLHYFHVALEEFFNEEIKIDYPTLIKKHRLGFPTVHLETNFMKPLWYGNKIEIEVGVEKIGKTSIKWVYRTFKKGDDREIIVGRNITVCLNMDTFKKIDVPGWLLERLNKIQIQKG